MNLKKIFTLITVVGILFPFSVSGQKNMPGLDYLGRGYNIFGKYANPDDCRAQLFDFSTQNTTQTGGETYFLPEGIEFINASKKEVKTISGNSSHQYIKELGVSAGLNYDGFLFKGSVEGSFFNSQFGFSSTAFTTVTDANTKWRLWFDIMTDTDITDLRKRLRPRVKERLNSSAVAPEQIFKEYGTHYLADIYIGATAYLNAVTTITEKMDISKIGVSVEASYGKVSGNASINTNNESKEVTENTQTEFNVVGGNAEFLKDLNNTELYIKWAEGIKEGAVLCNFSDKSLRPIWELCENETRAKQLEDYFFKTYLPSFPLPPIKEAKLNPLVAVNKAMKGVKDKPVYQGSFTAKGKKEYIYFSSNGIELIYGDKFENEKTIARYGTNLGSWAFTNKDEIIGTGDFNGDGKTDLLIKSVWGVGLLHLESDLYLKHYFMQPYGTLLGGWSIDKNDQLVIGIYHKDANKSYIAVKSDWGLGKLGYSTDKKSLISIFMKKCGEKIGGWQLNSNDKIFFAGDVDNNGFDDLLIKSTWGLGVLSGTNEEFSGLWARPYGTSIGGWSLDVNDVVIGIGDINGDKKGDILIKSQWGLGLLNYEHGLAAFWLKPYKTNLGHWSIDKGDIIIGAIDFTEDNKTDILITSGWGKGVLKWTGENVRHFWMRKE